MYKKYIVTILLVFFNAAIIWSTDHLKQGSVLHIIAAQKHLKKESISYLPLFVDLRTGDVDISENEFNEHPISITIQYNKIIYTCGNNSIIVEQKNNAHKAENLYNLKNLVLKKFSRKHQEQIVPQSDTQVYLDIEGMVEEISNCENDDDHGCCSDIIIDEAEKIAGYVLAGFENNYITNILHVLTLVTNTPEEYEHSLKAAHQLIVWIQKTKILAEKKAYLGQSNLLDN